MEEGEHLILVLLHKANLGHKEICASDWLKPLHLQCQPIFTLVFHVLHSGFGFALQKAYLQFNYR